MENKLKPSTFKSMFFCFSGKHSIHSSQRLVSFKQRFVSHFRLNRFASINVVVFVQAVNRTILSLLMPIYEINIGTNQDNEYSKQTNWLIEFQCITAVSIALLSCVLK